MTRGGWCGKPHQEVIRASLLPLSIIIVGVGAADFTDMHTLDADDAPLAAGGRTAVRDIVQFVGFRETARGGPAALAKVLAARAPSELARDR